MRSNQCFDSLISCYLFVHHKLKYFFSSALTQKCYKKFSVHYFISVDHISYLIVSLTHECEHFRAQPCHINLIHPLPFPSQLMTVPPFVQLAKKKPWHRSEHLTFFHIQHPINWKICWLFLSNIPSMSLLSLCPLILLWFERPYVSCEFQ